MEEKRMKTPNEIRAKIDKYLAKLDRCTDPDDLPILYGILDALLWVIEDSSGTPI